MGKVSIIMPVYNAEKYLSEAIESVLKQTYPDFELLLINDRSTDNSREICREFAKKDARIVLLENNTEIHGPGPTRNIGLDHATGEYIYFMDADDWIEDCLLQCAVNRMLKTNADIVQFGVIHERADGKYSLQYYLNEKDILTKDEIQKDFLSFWKESGKSLWMHLFRQDLIKTIRFENIINGEDTGYLMDALCKVETIAYIPEAYYHYRYVEGSTSHHWVENTIECLAVLWNHQQKFLESFRGELDQLAYAVVAYDNYIWAIYQLSSNLCTLSYGEKKRELLNLEEKMGFDDYRSIYPLKIQRGLMKVKYALVKYCMESTLLLLNPLFMRIVRGA